MKYAKAAFLLVGLILLAVIVTQTDLSEVWGRLQQVGWVGFAIILLIYMAAYIGDTAAWQLTLPSARPNLTWLYRLWKVRMVGSAFNRVTPMASLGGEPIKAVILKRHYGIGYRDGTASLVLAVTIYNIALVIFLCLGFVIMLAAGSLSPTYRLTAAIGLFGFSISILLFFLLQRYKLLSRAGTWFSRDRIGERATSLLQLVHDVEDRLIAFYTTDRRRFIAATAFALGNWILGVVEVYYAMLFLGHPVSFADAWVIEAVVVLVRTAFFLVPANLGTQEGGFILIVGAVTGSAPLGLAVAALTRCRELVWIAWGLAIGAAYPSARRPVTPSTADAE